MTLTSYKKLCTEFYDLSKPQAGPKEIQFYENFFKNREGPFLEAMCGSGRLLLLLLKKGFIIHGVDNSPEMLASCSKRCQENNLYTELFNQSLQDLSLPHKYSVIFIAVGSFQLIKDRSVAFQILQRFYQHLLPGGILLLDMFVPWDAIKEGIKGTCLLETTKNTYKHKVSSPEGFDITISGTTTVHLQEQFEVSKSHYEKIVQNQIVATEDEELFVRWYYRYEMSLFLEKSGFSHIKVLDESFELDPHAIVYQATK